MVEQGTAAAGRARAESLRAAVERGAKRFAHAVCDAIPMPVARAIIKRAATAPPAAKTWLFERGCSAIARRHFASSGVFLRTNLGISQRLDCKIPIHKPGYLFGRPENNLPERATLALVSALLPDCAHFVDVGANEGIFTFVAAMRGPRPLALHWFEPDRELHDRAQTNLQRNGIIAHGHRLAASNENRTAVFYRNLTDDSSGSLAGMFAALHDVRQEL